MESNEKTVITVQTEVNAPIEIVWKLWTTPEDVEKWNHASDDWYTPHAENDFREAGKFNYRMEARDGSMGFEFWGIYDKIIVNENIRYTLGDGRKVNIAFSSLNKKTIIVESFEAENMNSLELQQGGWQAILNNFKVYAETI